MIILIALIIVSIWWALVFSVYSIFAPFIENFWNVRNYNIAYYWAVASLERWHLALRYREAWFQWSGWWIWNDNFWPQSDARFTWYKRLSDQNNWTYWEILSISRWSIPHSWEWNVEIRLQYNWSSYWWPSENYNVLSYSRVEEFNLFRDATTTDIYTYGLWWTTPIWVDVISWSIRIPPMLYELRWVLDANDALICDICDFAWDWIPNDIMVSWSLNWADWSWPFSIIPTVTVDYSWATVLPQDSLIRRDIINYVMEDEFSHNSNLYFWNNNNPVFWPLVSLREDLLSWHSTMPNNHAFKYSNFVDIFNDSLSRWVSSLKLRMFVVNLLQTNSWMIYPFLEYRLEFLDNSWNPVDLPSRNYDISWYWIVWDYKVQIYQAKSTSDSTSWWDFVILF